MLSPYTNEKVDLLNIVNTIYTRELEANELIAKFHRKFLTLEIMPLNESEIEQQVSQFEAFQTQTENHALHLREFLK